MQTGLIFCLQEGIRIKWVNMENFTVNILGTDYKVIGAELKDENIDGDCDSTSHEIRIRTKMSIMYRILENCKKKF